MKSWLNDIFDRIYVLNLPRNKDRRNNIDKIIKDCGIEYELFKGVDGTILKSMWSGIKNPYFKNSNYLACSLSHLLIYRDALDMGYESILVLEDDILPNRGLVTGNPIHFPKYDDILYLGYIPLSDDKSKWDYNVAWSPGSQVDGGFFRARNLWGLYGYSPSIKVMEKTLSVYMDTFPMELDRWFVEFIQPSGGCVGFSPQLFCHSDGVVSENMGIVVPGMVERSVDRRFAELSDYY
jgi:hypothetical protein